MAETPFSMRLAGLDEMAACLDSISEAAAALGEDAARPLRCFPELFTWNLSGAFDWRESPPPLVYLERRGTGATAWLVACPAQIVRSLAITLAAALDDDRHGGARLEWTGNGWPVVRLNAPHPVATPALAAGKEDVAASIGENT